MDLDVPDGVYEPREDSRLLRDALPQDLVGEAVLDVGTGSGVIAVAAAERGAEVVAVDVNPTAVAAARANAERADVDADVRESDMFAAVEERFDLVACNPPYVPGEEELGTDEEKAWRGGERGRAFIDRFIAEVGAHVVDGGTVLLLQSSRNGVEETVERFAAEGFAAEVVAEEKLPWERLVVIRAVPEEK